MSTNEHNNDLDPIETREWLDAYESVKIFDGDERAQYLLNELINFADVAGVVTGQVNTPYRNTISVLDQPEYPGDVELEQRIKSLIRWNAVIMVLRAGKYASELGGHIASYASAATLYEVGFNHFFRGKTDRFGGDLVYFQGHSSPGIYARAFLEGRLSEESVSHFRQEVDGKGVSSYPHPWLMPDFWQFATVSMGLGPHEAVYQARFLKYMINRDLLPDQDRKVWCFCGDGEMDEPESTGALSIAVREQLDNLIFVINCNLQRLDGPVRGNSLVIQEFERLFRGVGWNVIKVLWGEHWDALFAKDHDGMLVKRMGECVDGDYQNYRARDGAYIRENFFGKYPELETMVEDMSDDEIWFLNRGGHCSQKVFAAYAKAVAHRGQPTVILAKTVKGYGMGAAGEGQNTTHQQKKMSIDHLKAFRDRFDIPVNDKEIEALSFCRPAKDSPEMQYLHDRRKALGGYLPSREQKGPSLEIPALDSFNALLQGSGEREISTTMAFVRMLTLLTKDKTLGKYIVPIVPDESRTFGMEGMFRQLGIYSAAGQLYDPVDSDQVMYYREEKDGQILQEGLNEAGGISSWIAAGMSYSLHSVPMIPFYIYYSMFGFQRVGDFIWSAGDMQARGFLLGGTAGRTTIAGEGLQHQDGHSHLVAATIPNCITYDPTFSYELVVIIHDGLKRMYVDQENIFYYLTVMNENYTHPKMPEGVEEGIIKGMYLFDRTAEDVKHRVRLLGSGAILREAIHAAEELEAHYGVGSDIWSVTSFNELARDGSDAERWNRLHPTARDKRQPYVSQCLGGQEMPTVASTDYMQVMAEQIRRFIPGNYHVLGTDGYGRSDTRNQLRSFFEVDYRHIVVTALSVLVERGGLTEDVIVSAIERYGIDPEKPNPLTV